MTNLRNIFLSCFLAIIILPTIIQAQLVHSWTSSWDKNINYNYRALTKATPDKQFTITASENDNLLLLTYHTWSGLTNSKEIQASGRQAPYAIDIEYDQDGNANYVYVAGFSEEAFALWKFDLNFNLIWERKIDENLVGTAVELIVKGEAESRDGVYVAGYTRTSSANYRIAKFTRDGNLEWSQSYDGPASGNDYITDMALVGNYLYVTGYSVGSNQSFDYATVAIGHYSGTKVWEKRYLGTGGGDDIAYGIEGFVYQSSQNENGNIIWVTGTSMGTGGLRDFTTIQYSGGGNEDWVQRYYDPNDDRSHSGANDIIMVDGNPVVTGLSSSDIAIVKYQWNSGNQMWARRYSGSDNGTDHPIKLFSMDKNIYVVGYTESGGTGKDYLFLKYDSDGNELAAAKYESLGEDMSTDGDVLAGEVNLYGGVNGIIITGIKTASDNTKSILTVQYSDQGTNTSVSDEEIENTFSLDQNYPNPFNPSTEIKFSIPEQSFVSLSVYDVLGREVSQLVNNQMQAGDHTVNFDASGLSTGIYFYKIEAGSFVEVKKMSLLK